MCGIIETRYAKPLGCYKQNASCSPIATHLFWKLPPGGLCRLHLHTLYVRPGSITETTILMYYGISQNLNVKPLLLTKAGNKTFEDTVATRLPFSSRAQSVS